VKQGFEIEAVDISKIGLQILQTKARKEKLKIKIKLADLNKFKIKNQYTALICAFTIHNLSHKNGLGLVNKMQKHTKIGGLNLITAFTRNSYFYENRKNQINFYPPSKFELTQLYAGWKILENIEEKIKIRPTREDGSPIFSTFAGILAQKRA
jgi:tellurite methyltransferase